MKDDDKIPILHVVVGVQTSNDTGITRTLHKVPISFRQSCMLIVVWVQKWSNWLCSEIALSLNNSLSRTALLPPFTKPTPAEHLNDVEPLMRTRIGKRSCLCMVGASLSLTKGCPSVARRTTRRKSACNSGSYPNIEFPQKTRTVSCDYMCFCK